MIFRILSTRLYLIEILHQTTTLDTANELVRKLYLIEILHQTTTCGKCEECLRRLYLIEILHQTTTFSTCSFSTCCCILSKFYIKPQQQRSLGFSYVVVSYRNSTSNHNNTFAVYVLVRLYLIEILHQTTTVAEGLVEIAQLYLIEILHQTTTKRALQFFDLRLYLIEILHQTTTKSRTIFTCRRLYLIEILHQTTTVAGSVAGAGSCILSKFYIKPQLDESSANDYLVVSYRNSTSNHNHRGR